MRHLITAPRTRHRGRRAPYHKPDMSSESTESETLRPNTRKRRGSPLPVAQNKRAKLDPGTSEANNKRRPRATVSAPKLNSRSVPSQSDRTAAREERLRSDPNADVKGPMLVTCRLCGKDVKLSNRNAYEISHWTRHTQRCKTKHDTGNVRDVGSKAVLSVTSENMAEKPEFSSRPIARISPGSSPLKLRISFSKSPRGSVPLLENSSGDAPNPTVVGDDVFVQSEVRIQSTKPSVQIVAAATPEAPLQRAASHKRSESSESRMTDINIMTPPVSPRGLPTVAIASPSSDLTLDELRDSRLESKAVEQDEKWTDGEHTSSPQEMFLAESFLVARDAAQSKTDGDLAEVVSDGSSGIDVDGVEPLGGMALQGCKDKSKADIRISRLASQLPAAERASLLQDASLVDIPVATDAIASPSSANMPSAEPTTSPPSPELEQGMSDLEFEYPDWVQPAFSDAFERDLQAFGICPENVVTFREIFEPEDGAGYVTVRGMESMASMVAV